MKKIINGKLYNTETATCLGSWSNGHDVGDFTYCEESLYRTKSGNYFIFGLGGANSKYSQQCGQNSYSGGSDITVISEGDAKNWAEDHLDADEYIAAFGQPEEG
jgi:hypothetical protein